MSFYIAQKKNGDFKVCESFSQASQFLVGEPVKFWFANKQRIQATGGSIVGIKAKMPEYPEKVTRAQIEAFIEREQNRRPRSV